MTDHMTTREEFRQLAAHHRVVPVARKVLADGLSTLNIYRVLAENRPGTFLLESAPSGKSWSRWSFIGTGASSALRAKDGHTQWIGYAPDEIPIVSDPLDAIQKTLAALHTAKVPGLPPLTSGLVGYLGYDMVRYIEDLPTTTTDDLNVPDMVQLLVDTMAVVDHHEGTVWLIANAVNWDNSLQRVDEAYDHAVERIDELLVKLASVAPGGVQKYDDEAQPNVRRQVTSARYHERIEACKEHIRAGDAFQIVLSQRFEVDTQVPAIDIYRILRVTNPSPYMYLMNVPTDDFSDTAFTIVGSSPESLVRVQDGQATMHPIAGSRPRGATPEEDLANEQELLADEKENSEHLMLVDLGRNDIGKISKQGTVEVHDFRHVERYSAIMHLVSGVSGELRDGVNSVDVVSATFPAGTLSGAPKPSAMSIIDELEDTRRGIYGGTVGYFDFSGNTDQAIAIRTGLYKDGTVYVQAGAGIVADSDPAAEDAECQHKAAAVVKAVAVAETLTDVRRTRD